MPERDALGDFLLGLLGGGQAGYAFRTGERERQQDRAIAADERKRRHVSEQDAARIRDAQELRAQIGFELGNKNDELARMRQDRLDRQAQQTADRNRQRQMEQDFVARLPDDTHIVDPVMLRRYAVQDPILQGKEYAGPGVSDQAAAANREQRAAERMNPAANIELARSRAEPDVQGSYLRRGHAGTAGGFVVDAGTRNVNLSARMLGPGGRPLTLPERQARQSADAFEEAVTRMEELERNDPSVAQISDWAAIAEGAGRLPVVGSAVQGATGPLSQRLMTPGQQEYRNLLNLAVDHYIGTLKIRASNEVLRNLRNNLALQAGQSDPRVAEGLLRTRAYLRRRVRATAYGPEAVENDGSAETDTPVTRRDVAVPGQPNFSRFGPE